MLIGVSSLKAKGVQLLGAIGIVYFNSPDQRARTLPFAKPMLRRALPSNWLCSSRSV
jgi:hypothetical protein